MKILSISTSSNICSVAVLENTNLLKEINLDNGLTHSESLMPTIDKMLKSINLSLSQIDLLVSDKGPGSFTGIRIGAATIIAFEDSLNIPTVGISSLEALAYNIVSEGIICSLIDAKNSNCYCGIFELSNGTYKQIEKLSAEHIDIILEKIKKYSSSKITFVGNGAIVNKQKIISAFSSCILASNNNLCAYPLGIAGFKAYLRGNYENVMPLYLRKSQAERMLEEKNNGNT